MDGFLSQLPYKCHTEELHPWEIDSGFALNSTPGWLEQRIPISSRLGKRCLREKVHQYSGTIIGHRCGFQLRGCTAPSPGGNEHSSLLIGAGGSMGGKNLRQGVRIDVVQACRRHAQPVTRPGASFEFRVWRFRFQVSGFGFRVSGSRLRV